MYIRRASKSLELEMKATKSRDEDVPLIGAGEAFFCTHVWNLSMAALYGSPVGADGVLNPYVCGSKVFNDVAMKLSAILFALIFIATGFTLVPKR